jgi:hypothetical protein
MTKLTDLTVSVSMLIRTQRFDDKKIVKVQDKPPTLKRELLATRSHRPISMWIHAATYLHLYNTALNAGADPGPAEA